MGTTRKHGSSSLKTEKVNFHQYGVGPYNSAQFKIRFMLGVPTTGSVRYEWAVGRYCAITPVNWSARETAVNIISPIGYHVDEARNIIVKKFLEDEGEWLFFVDHDVILPVDIWIKLSEYIKKADIPVMSGLYYAKGSHPEPLIFRGNGNGAFYGWKRGEKVWVTGLPMGCTLIHNSILRWCWDNGEPYKTPDGTEVRRVFYTPRDAWQDPETGLFNVATGTEDLWWCDRIIKNKVLEKTGWKKIAKKKYPFLVDTGIFCQHIDPDGMQYPANVGIR